LIVYEALSNIGVNLKLFNDQTNNRCDQKNNICIRLSNKLKIGESSKYATLIMKAAILDRSVITLTMRFVVAFFMRNLFSCMRLYEITKKMLVSI
jgi:hypothetical protein